MSRRWAIALVNMVCISSLLATRVLAQQTSGDSDDTQAIRRELNKRQSVVLESGRTYLITSTLRLGPETHLSCPGFGTVLRYTGDGFAVSLYATPQTSSLELSNVIQGCTIDISGSRAEGAIAVTAPNNGKANFHVMRDIQVIGTRAGEPEKGQVGITFRTEGDGQVWHNLIDGVHCLNLRTCILFEQDRGAATAPNTNTVRAIRCKKVGTILDITAGASQLVFGIEGDEVGGTGGIAALRVNTDYNLIVGLVADTVVKGGNGYTFTREARNNLLWGFFNGGGAADNGFGNTLFEIGRTPQPLLSRKDIDLWGSGSLFEAKRLAVKKGPTLIVGDHFTIRPDYTFAPVKANSKVTSDSLTAVADGQHSGQLLMIYNGGIYNVRLKNGANTRLARAADQTLRPGQVMQLIWDDEASEWLQVSSIIR